ncbi:hypothetical protein [Nonomuraea soli]|uniref:Class 3 adenylate cyclase n=1 Tax=Nonomuraea soli TaxID=1032476 RepID=A0A7W0CI09_9ACTN|nr:hypothetical protein [Nonomuraea soli]MBA2891305.1 class 3 adenylate cyclase [Nonomuraea soli]
MTQIYWRAPLVGADIVNYSAGGPLENAAQQTGLRDLLAQAAAAARLDHDAWQVQPSGDGVFAVLPRESDEIALVDGFVRHVNKLLRARDDSMRLRMSIHYGVLSEGDNGFPGKAPIVSGRLLDARPVRLAIERAPRARLAVLLSDDVYQGVVANGHTTWEPEDLREVDVSVKSFKGTGWLLMPGIDVQALDLGEKTGQENHHGQRVENVFHGSVQLGDGGVIGIQNR